MGQLNRSLMNTLWFVGLGANPDKHRLRFKILHECGHLGTLLYAMYGRRPRCKRESDVFAKRSGATMYPAAGLISLRGRDASYLAPPAASCVTLIWL
jgi:hypothetical protein